METLDSSATTKAIVVTNTITLNDFLKYSLLLKLKSQWFLWLIFACIYVYVGYIVLTDNLGGNVLFAFYVVFTLYMFGVIPAIMYFQLRKYYKTNKYIKENILYIFTNEGVETKAETFSSKLAWKTFYKIEEMNDMLLFYTDKYVAISFYKKNFKSPEDVLALKEMIKTQPIKQKFICNS
jgi:hypothetical protein